MMLLVSIILLLAAPSAPSPAVVTRQYCKVVDVQPYDATIDVVTICTVDGELFDYFEDTCSVMAPSFLEVTFADGEIIDAVPAI